MAPPCVTTNVGILKAINWRWYRTINYIKYLGLYVTQKMCLSLARTTLAKQASKAMFCILKQQRYLESFSPKDAFKLFDVIIRPILCYGADIWGYQYSAAIEKVLLQTDMRT